MRAAVIRGHGGPEVISIEQIPEPEARPGEVVVELRAAALNHLDVWVRRGGRTELQWPHVIGSDGAGIVDSVGANVAGVEPGQKVVINAGLACGSCEFCRAGEHSLCVHYGIIGMHRPGTYADKVAVPARCIAPRPAELSFEEGAALGIAYTTAWRMLFSRAGLQPGETVLIHGIGGGVALAALQFVKLAGARAVVTSSSDGKLDRARKLGADETVNYRDTDDVAAPVRELTNGRGVDVAFDSVGAATWPVDFAAVRRGGRIVLCGVTTGAEAETDLQALYWNQLTVLGSTMGSDREFRRMLQTVEAGGVRPVIDSVVPLEEVAEAQRRMEAGEQFGKIVLGIR
ncbi:MAG: zinc-binding dehydrogenase [Candidatus Brocadiaceae bacterium]|jgi:NADPH:quinone reductase-like Zn-dependent oxidoreductase